MMADTRGTAVRLFASDSPQLARTLRGELTMRRKDLATAVADGLAMDWADYKHRCGVIRGFDEAIQACSDAEDKLSGD